MNPVERVVRQVDAFQQRHRVTGFAFGVVKKFGDDRAGSLAALIAYYTFLALFPLLLLLVTILGFVAQNNVDFQHRLVHSTLAGFRLLTPRAVPSRELVPGAVLAGLAWSVLQLLGGYLVSQRLQQTSEVYGLFAIVLGLLFWLSLGAQISLYAAELNVVLARKLYPRSIVQPPLTEPDREALRQLAQQEERRPEERVSVDFVDEAPDGQVEQERTRAGPPPRAPTAPMPERPRDGPGGR